jgi:hypothetical protein
MERGFFEATGAIKFGEQLIRGLLPDAGNGRIEHPILSLQVPGFPSSG